MTASVAAAPFPPAAPSTANAGHGAIAYRPDIDGLRAIAVTSVVVFHAGLSLIPGGFVGVDIFFVISGYLIGGQIYREAGNRAFRYGAFYARRARRILPALFAMLLIFLMIGVPLMTPEEMRQFGKELVPALIGAANIFYYTAGDYFAPAAERSPLLMTWSLGVEEQFYLVLPILMLLVIRWRRDWSVPVILACSILSFAGSLVLMEVNPKAAFYLLPTRAWELGVGVLLAVQEQRRGGMALTRGPTSEALSIVGLAMLAIAILAYDAAAYSFPGIFVLLPVIGTAILIATRSSLPNRRWLGAAPMTFIGKISYSWYLWHWPVFWLDHAIAEPGPGLPAPVLLILSFAMGVLSWRFVEQPTRRWSAGQARTLISYGVAMAAISGLGVALYAMGGLPGRLSATGRTMAQQALDARGSRCLAPYGAEAPVNPDLCLPALAPGQKGRLLLLGDSHASALAPGLADQAHARGMAFGEMTKSSCLPLADAARASPDRVGHREQCLAFQKAAFARAIESRDVTTVVIAGYWDNGDTVTDMRGRGEPLGTALARSAAMLAHAGKRVILMQDVPRFRFNPASRAIGATMPARAALMPPLQPGIGQGQAPVGLWESDRMAPTLAAIAARGGYALINPEQALCVARICNYAAGSNLYYQDEQHLTATGARHVFGSLMKGPEAARPVTGGSGQGGGMHGRH